MKIIYTAISKKMFYHRFSISKYVLNNGGAPLNPFMNFDYFMGEGIERDKVREANNRIVEMCDELWVFGDISNGVVAEIQIANQKNKPVRYFSVDDHANIIELNKNQVKFEK